MHITNICRWRDILWYDEKYLMIYRRQDTRINRAEALVIGGWRLTVTECWSCEQPTCGFHGRRRDRQALPDTGSVALLLVDFVAGDIEAIRCLPLMSVLGRHGDRQRPDRENAGPEIEGPRNFNNRKMQDLEGCNDDGRVRSYRPFCEHTFSTCISLSVFKCVTSESTLSIAKTICDALLQWTPENTLEN